MAGTCDKVNGNFGFHKTWRTCWPADRIAGSCKGTLQCGQSVIALLQLSYWHNASWNQYVTLYCFTLIHFYTVSLLSSTPVRQCFRTQSLPRQGTYLDTYRAQKHPLYYSPRGTLWRNDVTEYTHFVAKSHICICIMFLSQHFSFPLSVSFHQCSIPIHSPTTYAV